MSFKPTDEQAVAMEHALARRGLRIEARAGAGKTSTLKLIANALPKCQMIYTSFGKKSVADFKTSAPRNVTAKTNHGLAYAEYGRFFQDGGRLTGSLPARNLAAIQGWGSSTFAGLDAVSGAHYVLQTIANFCQSAERALTEEHVVCKDDPLLAHAVFSVARKLWSAMSDTSNDQRQSITHDVYLKMWALSDPQLPADVLLLDEAQDSTPLIIDLFSKQRCQLIVVGDTHQQIYSWRGAVNAMGAFNLEAAATLSQSFRFGPRVADAANVVLQSALDRTINLRGLDSLDTRLGSVDTGTVITRTNSGLIGELAATLSRKQSAVIVGGTTDLIRLLESVTALQEKRTPTAPELAGFIDWNEVEIFSKTPPGKDLSVLVALVSEYGAPRLQTMVGQVPANPTGDDEDRADVILTTAHKSKGREWDQVRLAGDFCVVTPMDIRGTPLSGSRWKPEESRLLYVAVTRAQKVLDLAGCDGFGSHLSALREMQPRNPLSQPSHPLIVAIDRAASPATADQSVAAPTQRPEEREHAGDHTALVQHALADLQSAQTALLAVHARLISACASPLSSDEVILITRPVAELYRSARGIAEDWRQVNKPRPTTSAVGRVPQP